MTETAQTIKDSLEVITPYLQSLADKLDTTASYLWAIQIKQAYIQGFTSLAIPLILAVIAFVAYKVSLSISRECLEDKTKEVENYNKIHVNDYSYREKTPPSISEYYSGIIFATAIPLLLSTVYFFSRFNDILTCFFNPEYYALQQLINMFK